MFVGDPEAETIGDYDDQEEEGIVRSRCVTLVHMFAKLLLSRIPISVAQ